VADPSGTDNNLSRHNLSRDKAVVTRQVLDSVRDKILSVRRVAAAPQAARKRRRFATAY
jgi:hypothetical protein